MAQPLIFLGLDPAEVQRIVAGARKRAFRRDDIVFHQGDPGDSMQVVVRGHFALRLTTSRGDIFMNRIFPPGDMFGRVAVAPLEAAREATVVCRNGGETFELFRAQLDELRAAHPSVNDMLLAGAGQDLRRVSELLLEAMYVDADRRVRRRLVELGELFREPETGVAVIPLTQEDVAAIAGTSRATVSRVLAEEEGRGTLAKGRQRIVLLDEAELSRWARWPDEFPAASSVANLT